MPSGSFPRNHVNSRPVLVCYGAGRTFLDSPDFAMKGECAAQGRGTARAFVLALLPFLVSAMLPGGARPAQSPEQALAEAERHRLSGNSAAALDVLDRAAEDFPDRPLIHFNRGALFGEDGRYEEAAEALRAGLELDPAHPDARLTLAKVLVRLHRFEEALVHVDRYAAIVGDLLQGFDGHYVRGLALRRLERFAEAERELLRATEIDPGHVDALFNLGAVLDQRGSDEEAVAYLQKAATLQPGNPDVRYRLANLLIRRGEPDAGRAELERFRELRERTQLESRVSVMMRQAELEMGAGDPGAARDLYQQVIRQDAENAEAHANLGVAYEQLGRGDLAEAMFRKAIALRPDYADARLNLGLKQAARGEFEVALENISEAVRLSPDHVAARQGLAMVLTRLNRPNEAVPHFEAVLLRTPDSAQAHLNLGIALAEGGRPEEALASFREARRLAPESSRPHYNLGRALNDLGRIDEARDALEASVELDDGFAPAIQLLGLIERNARKDQRAIELLARAARLDPQNPLAHYDLGLAIAQGGDPDGAVPHWERALALDPRHEESLYNLAHAVRETAPHKAREYSRRFAALKAEEQDTDRAGTLWNFALAEAKKERWSKAFDLFRQALEVCGDCPARGQIHKNFGLVYGHSGDFPSAERELMKAQRLLPDDVEVQEALRVVRQSL